MQSDMSQTQKITAKSDGQRQVSITAASREIGCYDISVCRNGHQSTVVTLDEQMILWLRNAITEHLAT